MERISFRHHVNLCARCMIAFRPRTQRSHCSQSQGHLGWKNQTTIINQLEPRLFFLDTACGLLRLSRHPEDHPQRSCLYEKRSSDLRWNASRLLTDAGPEGSERNVSPSVYWHKAEKERAGRRLVRGGRSPLSGPILTHGEPRGENSAGGKSERFRMGWGTPIAKEQSQG